MGARGVFVVLGYTSPVREIKERRTGKDRRERMKERLKEQTFRKK